MVCLLTTNSSSDKHRLPFNGSTPALLQSTTINIGVLCLLLPVPLIAMLGNLLIVASVVRFRNLRTPTNIFVVSLAMADFLLAVLVMPFSLVCSVDRWRFGGSFCIGHTLMDISLSLASIFNLSCVALERYVAVCDPLHYRVRVTTRLVILLLIFCWLLPLLLSMHIVSLNMYLKSPPAGTGMQSVLQGNQNQQACLDHHLTPYAAAASSLSFFIPMGIMVFVYWRIFLAAQRQVKWIHAMEHKTEQLRGRSPRLHQGPTIEDQGPARLNQGPSRAEQSGQLQDSGPRLHQGPIKPGNPCCTRKEWKAARTLGLIMGVFLLCWLPFFIVHTVSILWGFSINPVVLEVFIWLGYTNSSLNPFLYACFNRQFKLAFVTILRCGMLGRQLSILNPCREAGEYRGRSAQNKYLPSFTHDACTVVECVSGVGFSSLVYSNMIEPPK